MQTKKTKEFDKKMKNEWEGHSFFTNQKKDWLGIYYICEVDGLFLRRYEAKTLKKLENVLVSQYLLNYKEA